MRFPSFCRGLVPAVLVLIALAAAPARADVAYSLTDGTAEDAIGLTFSGTLTAANQFTVLAGGEILSSVSILWGSPTITGINVPNGTPVTIKLWSDPDGDGNPTDAILLSAVPGVTAGVGTNTFITYDLPDVTLPVGQSFFAGATIAQPGDVRPFGIDLTAPIDNRGFAAVSNDITAGPIPITAAFNADLTIRAGGIAAASAIPEPGTLSLLAAGLPLGAAVLRRRHA